MVKLTSSCITEHDSYKGKVPVLLSRQNLWYVKSIICAQRRDGTSFPCQ